MIRPVAVSRRVRPLRPHAGAFTAGAAAPVAVALISNKGDSATDLLVGNPRVRPGTRSLFAEYEGGLVGMEADSMPAGVEDDRAEDLGVDPTLKIE